MLNVAGSSQMNLSARDSLQTAAGFEVAAVISCKLTGR